MTELPLTPRPASTLIPVRDGSQGIEVLMMQRTHHAAFAPGGYVFPGGAVDTADADIFFEHCAVGLEVREASRRLRLKTAGLRYWVAAIRECFEEAGLLLAYDEDRRLVDLERPAAAERMASLRHRVASGELRFAELCRTFGLQLALDRLAYFGHWITPVGSPRRFDTRFFICVAPERQTPSHDNCETIGHMWVSPAEALARHRSGEIDLLFVTRTTLEALARFGDTGALMHHAHSLDAVPTREPRVATGRNGRGMLINGDHAYAEVGKLDPSGKGTASCEIVPGTVTRLSATVRRVTAPNPSFMTGPGTNTYLVGNGDALAVIDPGPAHEEHVQSLLTHANGRIRWILATHTHMDHSPAARMLKERTGAQLIGMPAPETGRQDHGFQPDIVVEDGQRIDVGGITLRAIHTPGHASNHLCYLLEEEQLLFTGDHIMQGSTVVLNPPDGDLRAYLSSLQRLKQLDVEYLAPGHGFLMDKPGEVIDRIVAHRLARERKVLAALAAVGSATAEELLAIVYDDVPEERIPVAFRSLLAHLGKLAAEGRASDSGGRWSLVGEDS